ncbi:MAG: biotin transporter BioY [Gemmatimonadales bacterium]
MTDNARTPLAASASAEIVAARHVAPVRLTLQRILAVVCGAALVAVASQFAIPLPFTPVPVSLEGGAVLLVGGLLGWRYGALALLTFLAVGAAGMPVFADGTFGLARLVGPTAGYLFAFPVAAGVVGYLARPGALVRSMLAALVGMVVIHLGGWAWLAILTGSARQAFTWGSVPFLLTDLLAVAIAGGLTARLGARTRRFV